MKNFFRTTPVPLLVFEVAMMLVLLNIVNQMSKDGKALQAVEQWPEPVMPTVVVTREDPYPCLTDALARAACDRLGCINRCER